MASIQQEQILGEISQRRQATEAIGASVSYVISESGGDVVAEYRQEVEHYSASLSKLPLALMAIDLLNPEEQIHIPANMVSRVGSGAYDHRILGFDASVAELLDDMLRLSGNTAQRALALRLGGPDLINEYYADHHWQTRVDRDPETGRMVPGRITAQETLALITAITANSSDAELAKVATGALANSGVAVGMRPFLAPGLHGIRSVSSKTGDFEGDNDIAAVRHETALINGEIGSFAYAVLASIPAESGQLAVWNVNAMRLSVGICLAELAGDPRRRRGRTMLSVMGIKNG